MSITTGYEVRKKDPAKERPDSQRPYVSWKDPTFNMWVLEWLYKFETNDTKNDVLRMAEDIIKQRFDVCPDAYGFFSEYVEEYALRYGNALYEMVTNMQVDEYLRYYNLELGYD